MNISVNIPSCIEQYDDYYNRILPTGSRVMCDPPVNNTDEDYLILVNSDVNRLSLETVLQGTGWTLGGSLPNAVDTDTPVLDWTLDKMYKYTSEGTVDQTRLFHSWKSWNDNDEKIYNLLVTCNPQYFEDFTRATFLCKGLNLQDKWQRILVFEALTRDSWPNGNEYLKHLSKMDPRLKSKYIFSNTASIEDTVSYQFWNIPINGVTAVSNLQAQAQSEAVPG